MNANEGTHNLFILSSSPSCSPVTFLFFLVEAVGRCGTRRNMWMTNNGFRDFLVSLTQSDFRFFHLQMCDFAIRCSWILRLWKILNCINIMGFCWNYGRRWSYVNFNQFQKPHLPVLLPPGPRGFTVSWLHWGGPRAVARWDEGRCDSHPGFTWDGSDQKCFTCFILFQDGHTPWQILAHDRKWLR